MESQHRHRLRVKINLRPQYAAHTHRGPHWYKRPAHTRPRLAVHTNNNATLWSILIDISTGATTGPAKLVSANVTGDDDFTADGKGNIFIASDGALRSLEKGSSVAGTIANVDGTSAVHFGRKEGDGDVLYVSSTGGIECYIGGDCPSSGGLYIISM